MGGEISFVVDKGIISYRQLDLASKIYMQLSESR